MTNTHKSMANGSHLEDEDEVAALRREMQELKRQVAELRTPAPVAAHSVESEPKCFAKPTRKNAEALPKNHPFYGWPHSAEIADLYLGRNRRTAIGNIINRRGKKQDGTALWNLILTAWQGGLLQQNDDNSSSVTPVTLRSLIPCLPAGRGGWANEPRFHLDQPKNYPFIRDVVLPMAIQNRDAVLADQLLLQNIVKDEEARRRREAQQKQAMGNLKEGEQPIIIAGEMMWPRPTHRIGDYTYEMVYNAAWTARFFDQCFKGEPKSRAIHTRNSTRYMANFLPGRSESEIKKFFSLLHEASRLISEPKQAEDKWPPHIIRTEE